MHGSLSLVSPTIFPPKELQGPVRSFLELLQRRKIVSETFLTLLRRARIWLGWGQRGASVVSN